MFCALLFCVLAETPGKGKAVTTQNTTGDLLDYVQTAAVDERGIYCNMKLVSREFVGVRSNTAFLLPGSNHIAI